MKISSFEASLIRSIKFYMMIFGSIVCLKVSLFWELQDKGKNGANISLDHSCNTNIDNEISKHLARISRLRKLINSKLVNLKSQTR